MHYRRYNSYQEHMNSEQGIRDAIEEWREEARKARGKNSRKYFYCIKEMRKWEARLEQAA